MIKFFQIKLKLFNILLEIIKYLVVNLFLGIYRII